MKLKNNQSGVAHVAAILLVILIAAVGVVGWKVWDNNKKDETTAPASSSTNQTEQSATDSTDSSTSEYINISEWGVKLKHPDAAKLTYTYSSESGEDIDGNGYDSSVTLAIKPEYLQDKSCGLGFGIHRTASPTDVAVLVGDYYFWSTGGPGPCNIDADTELKKDILAEYKDKNLETL